MATVDGGEGRAFWLTRLNASDGAAIDSALEGMASLHANTLFIRVYGDGLTLHRSARVPRPDLVEPGFDPLALAVVEGHRRGIEVHAWMNICNTWSGGLGTPASPTHLVRLHPEWAVVDVIGKSDIEFVGVPDTLIFFCPRWEGFRDYSLQVAAEIAGRYAADGIHLDYLRFPGRRSALLGFLFPGQGAPACPDAAGGLAECRG